MILLTDMPMGRHSTKDYSMNEGRAYVCVVGKILEVRYRAMIEKGGVGSEAAYV